MRRIIRKLWRRARRDEGGAVLVEFAIALPVLLLIMAAFADFGSILFQRLRLDEAVSAAANHAILHSARIDASGPQGFAAELGNVLAAASVRPPASFRVNLNDHVEFREDDGIASVMSLAGLLESCYCPIRNASGFSFGPTHPCGSSCADGSRASRYIVLEASKAYSPIFTSYGLAEGDLIRTRAIVPILP